MEVGDDNQPLIDPEVRAFVFSLASALGGSSAGDDGRYVLGDDALAVLKDIKRWLKLYDDKLGRFDVARLLVEANLVKGDLLEILAIWREDAPEGSFMSKIALLCGMVGAERCLGSMLTAYSRSTDTVDMAYSYRPGTSDHCQLHACPFSTESTGFVQSCCD